MDAIRTEALTKHYKVGFWRPRPYVALDRLPLQAGAGEVFGFLGPNGAGKSTTLKLLMQLIYPTSGEARILGRPLGDLAGSKRLGSLAAPVGAPPRRPAARRPRGAQAHRFPRREPVLLRLPLGRGAAHLLRQPL